jgi:hypothetical protein
VAPKRRLPLLQSAEETAGEPARAPWQWIGFWTVAIFVAWLPLSALAARLGGVIAARAEGGDPARLVRTGIVVTGAYGVALALGALAGGFVVGRWGAEGVGVREAALAALGATVVAVVISWTSFGVAFGPLLVAVVAVPMAALGGKLGVRRRSHGK